MSYIIIPPRTSNDINSSSDINQLMENCDWLKDNRYPVGSYYIQFPDANSNDSAVAFPTSQSPTNLFGGTWTKVFDTEGIFFRTEGNPYGEGQNHLRTNGKQSDTFQGHTLATSKGKLSTITNASYPLGNDVGTAHGNGNIPYTIATSSYGTPRIGYETRPLNRLIRVWKRTA